MSGAGGIKLDAYDVKILAALQRNGRITKIKLAEEIGLSPSPCWERMRRLESQGLIHGYHADIDIEQLLHTSTILVEVSLRSHQSKDFERFEQAIMEVPEIVDRCSHAMALHERRETFDVTRLDRDGQRQNVQEVWFRGVHSDIGGGGGNPGLAGITLEWMVDRAREVEVPVNRESMKEILASADPVTPIGSNFDPFLDPRRTVEPGDEVHQSARGEPLDIGEACTFVVNARDRYSPSGIHLEAGAHYSFSVPADQQWFDEDISCGPEGWRSEDLPWAQHVAVRFFEPKRRCRTGNWFELIGAVGDFDDHFFRIGAGGDARTYTAPEDGMLYAFANDLYSRYGNNTGTMKVTVTRVSEPGAETLMQCGDRAHEGPPPSPR